MDDRGPRAAAPRRGGRHGHAGRPGRDVGSFLVGSLTIADRRRAEADLLTEYSAALDVPDETRPSFEDAWTHYRASAAYGLAIWLSTLGTDGFPRRESSLALTERYGAAHVDLDGELALTKIERS
ncbi:hypothetical protein [Pseudofrankia sp. DC12]|uniref:hypothetical protein n=1 Tax=Pseudofrankia sp. DC12 TaxID=683315 RepID=UPI0005F80215|nr:hypothetical protein [Pseudofrankia sp. DC12]